MRYTQPQSGPAPVDTSHPLAKGLALTVNPGTSPFRDMAGRTAVRNGISVAPGPRGIGYVAASNASLGVQFATSPMRTSNGAGTGDFTYLVIANPVASTTREFFVCCQNGANEFYFGANFGIGLGASSGIVSAQTNTTSPSGVDVPAGADGRPHVYVYTRNSVSSLGSLYVDGSLGASSSVISPVMWSSGSSDYVAGYSGAGWGISKGVFLVLGWNRALSAAEVKSISANPWQLFRSPQRIYAATVGGGPATYSYTATGGFVVAGTSPAVRGLVKTPTGGLNLSGTTPAIRGAIKAPIGGISLSGAALTLRGRILAGLGGMSFSGTASLVFTSAVQSLTVTPVGGLIIRGTSAMVRTIVRAVSGGIHFAGSSATTLTPDPNPPSVRSFKRGRRPRTRKNY
jgi:hypothetical protein